MKLKIDFENTIPESEGENAQSEQNGETKDKKSFDLKKISVNGEKIKFNENTIGEIR